MDNLDLNMGNIIELQQIYKLLEPHPNLLRVYQDLLIKKNEELASLVNFSEDSDTDDSDSEYEGESSIYQSD
mgnify:CR=1 FL=1|tara:strand:- start:377 stop:592 length:216 start_codon:yes stop_codon:yes gene_type:complete